MRPEIARILRYGFKFLLVAVFAASCTPQKKVIYFQGNFNAVNDSSAANYFKLKIVPGDIVVVNVFTINPEAFPYFNVASEKQASDMRSAYEKGYTVSDRGTIEMPLIGEVNVVGMTMTEAADAIRDKLKKFMDEPMVTVKKLNFKITVLGEVVRPGTFDIYKESVTLPEVLGMAGDVGPAGNRTNLKIIRNNSKTPQVITVDLTQAASLTLENYYLHPNDIIYVEPLKRRQFQNIGPTVTLVTSLITTTILVLTFIAAANNN
jgi:polysaccharide export outer membrane protein